MLHKWKANNAAVSVMRFKESVEQGAYLRRASELGHVELVFASLDVLGSTPWQINRPVFDVVLQVWNGGFRMPKIPAVHGEPRAPHELVPGAHRPAASMPVLPV